jgi:cytidylate kinase
MSLVIALFGKSCVGKTRIAGLLANTLKIPVRHCGELVKDKARELGVASVDLPKHEHQGIDDQTRSLVLNSTSAMVVEGTYLDIVLDNIPNVVLIELICEDEERRKRFVARSGGSPITLEMRDKADEAFRQEFYLNAERSDQTVRSQKLLSIDTTLLNLEEVTSLIIKTVKPS